MPIKPSLTLEELQTIQKRSLDNADVRVLLWEVKRMRAFILRAYQLSGEFTRPPGVLAPVYDEWLATLMAEACGHERDTWIGDLLTKPDKPRKGMGALRSVLCAGAQRDFSMKRTVGLAG